MDNNDLVRRFKKLVYEPEHTETTCWCEPKFLKREDGNLEIVHNEQRDVLSAALVQEVERAVAEGKVLGAEGQNAYMEKHIIPERVAAERSRIISLASSLIKNDSDYNKGVQDVINLIKQQPPKGLHVE